MKSLTFAFLFIIVTASGEAVGQQNPSDFAYSFLNEYYLVKDLHKVKSYLHEDLIDVLDSASGITKKQLESSERLIGLWSDCKFTLIEEAYHGDDISVMFELNGNFDGRKNNKIIMVRVKKTDDGWKIYAF